MSKKIAEHYSQLFEEYGDDPRSTQYPDRESQIERFENLIAYASKEDSIGDIGCGTAEMLRFLIEERSFIGAYYGIDFTANLLQFSKDKYSSREKTSFLCGDAMEEKNYKNMDWYLCSGAFNNKFPSDAPVDNTQFLYITIKHMFNHSKKGIAFNALSTFVDYMDDHLFYIDPLEVFRFCRNELSPYVTLKHDYTLGSCKFPYEFTIYVHKK